MELKPKFVSNVLIFVDTIEIKKMDIPLAWANKNARVSSRKLDPNMAAGAHVIARKFALLFTETQMTLV